MPNGVLALTKDGRITYCTAPEDMRGVGRCNHIAHQKPGQSSSDFISSIENEILVEDDSIKDQTEYINTFIDEYTSCSENPNWEEIVKSINNPFTIGSEVDGTIETAEMTKFNQELIEKPDGNVYHLTATYNWRGKDYECDFGEVPVKNPDGSITMEGVNWRVIPVVEQWKSGGSSNYTKMIFKQDDNNLAMIISKDKNEERPVRIRGRNFTFEEVENYYATGDDSPFNSSEKWSLDHLDPYTFDRFEDFKTNLRQFQDVPPDEPNDLAHRRIIRYEDIVKEQMALQMRRMGVTFRRNINRQNDGVPEEKAPLFFQTNLTDNVRSELISRSNVQQADNLNPISALSQAEKISFVGPGGYNADNAPLETRLPHTDFENIIDPVDVAHGKNVGFSITLANGYVGEDRMVHQYGGKPYKYNGRVYTCKPGPKAGKAMKPADFVPYIENDDPNRAEMAVAHMKQACPITGGEDPIVKTDAWDKINGAKLGVNLRIAYIPDAGNFEDAVVISESAAAKMTTVQSTKYSCPHGTDGIIPGKEVKRKQIVNGEEIKIGGIIKNVTDNGFEVETTYKMTPGDKLAGRHGNKSVVSKVVPDNEMPMVKDANGKWTHAEVIMSPLSVAGRKNLGQIIETNIANSNNKDMKPEDYVDIKNDVSLPDGHRIKATSGIQYIMRLNHIAEKKLSSHADEITSSREYQGVRLGGMESILLTQSEDRVQVLKYLRHQEQSDAHTRMKNLLHAIGVDLTGVNWDK